MLGGGEALADAIHVVRLVGLALSVWVRTPPTPFYRHLATKLHFITLEMFLDVIVGS